MVVWVLEVFEGGYISHTPQTWGSCCGSGQLKPAAFSEGHSLLNIELNPRYYIFLLHTWMQKFNDFHLYYSAVSDKEVPLEMNLLAHIPHFEKLQPRKGAGVV